MVQQTLVVDLGGGSIKIGFASMMEPNVVDNCMMKVKTIRNRVFFGDDIDDCNNLSGMYSFMPFKKGYVNNWELQKQILDHIFDKIFKKESFSLSDVNVILTEPYFNFSSTKETMDEIFFEEYGVKGLIRTNPGFLVQYEYSKLHRNDQYNGCCLVIDSGYSFSHILPYKDGRLLKEYVKRISVGGKVLTNRLCEIISYRQLDVRSEIYVINQCKEDISFVSLDFMKDLQIAKQPLSSNTIVKEYILPDYANLRRGYMRPVTQITPGARKCDVQSKTDQEYVLRLANERFTVPEILLRPNEVGYDEMGLSEASVYVIDTLPTNLQSYFAGNIFLAGGNTAIPGLQERVHTEIKASLPDDFIVSVKKSPKPQISAWKGGALLANTPSDMKRYLVLKSDYEEFGHNSIEEKFPL